MVEEKAFVSFRPTLSVAARVGEREACGGRDGSGEIMDRQAMPVPNERVRRPGGAVCISPLATGARRILLLMLALLLAPLADGGGERPSLGLPSQFHRTRLPVARFP